LVKPANAAARPTALVSATSSEDNWFILDDDFNSSASPVETSFPSIQISDLTITFLSSWYKSSDLIVASKPRFFLNIPTLNATSA
jgi:hypothetical protein